jgi:ABC-type sugar transport system substrate-binding protein/ABC-type uncharacterized transport system ATPase subunit
MLRSAPRASGARPTPSIKDEAERLGVELKFSDAQQKQENQIKAIRSFIAQQVDVIGVSPVVETGWETVFQEAKDAGIPLILVDRRAAVPEDLYVTYLGSDFIEEGRRAGKAMSDILGGEGKIVELVGTVGSAPANDRYTGFREAIAEFPGMEIIASQSGDFTRAKGKEVMEAFLKSYGDEIDALYAHNDDMAIGAIQAIEEYGLKPGEDIKIVSIDAVRGAFEAMIEGKLNCTVECNPLLGPQFFELALQVVNGEEVAKWVPSEEASSSQSRRRNCCRLASTKLLDFQKAARLHSSRAAVSLSPSRAAEVMDEYGGCIQHLDDARESARPFPACRRSTRWIFPCTRRDSRPARRKRRRQVYADQGAHRRGTPDRGRHRAGWPRDRGEIAASRPDAWHQHRLSRDQSLPEPLGGGEHLIGREPRWAGSIDWRRLNARAAQILEWLEVDVDVRQSVGMYSVAIQQMVAISRALEISARVLILDEPTSSLAAHETEKLFAVMRKLKGEGIGVIFITHFLDQVYEVSDRITVLRNGKLVGVYDTATLPRVELVARMIGRNLDELQEMSRYKEATAGSEQRRVVAAGAGIGRTGSIAPFDLALHEGEVVGLAGLLGSGRTETANLLFGVDKPDSGIVCRWCADDASFSAAVDPSGHGLLPRRPQGRRHRGRPDRAREHRRWHCRPTAAGSDTSRPASQREIADKYIKLLNISTPTADQLVKNLSGGNQQKVILARWLATDPNILILDEPTRGIDIGAKAEIQKLVLDAGWGRQDLHLHFVGAGRSAAHQPPRPRAARQRHCRRTGAG